MQELIIGDWKARRFLKANRDHIANRELRLNGPLTPTDLERVLIEAGVATANDLNQLKEESGGLGLFIRSLPASTEKQPSPLSITSSKVANSLEIK